MILIQSEVFFFREYFNFGTKIINMILIQTGDLFFGEHFNFGMKIINMILIQSGELFFREHFHFGTKIMNMILIQSGDLFFWLPLEKIFPLSIFDCGSMAPLSKILGRPQFLNVIFVQASILIQS